MTKKQPKKKKLKKKSSKAMDDSAAAAAAAAAAPASESPQPQPQQKTAADQVAEDEALARQLHAQERPPTPPPRVTRSRSSQGAESASPLAKAASSDGRADSTEADSASSKSRKQVKTRAGKRKRTSAPRTSEEAASNANDGNAATAATAATAAATAAATPFEAAETTDHALPTPEAVVTAAASTKGAAAATATATAAATAAAAAANIEKKDSNSMGRVQTNEQSAAADILASPEPSSSNSAEDGSDALPPSAPPSAVIGRQSRSKRSRKGRKKKPPKVKEGPDPPVNAGAAMANIPAASNSSTNAGSSGVGGCNSPALLSTTLGSAHHADARGSNGNVSNSSNSTPSYLTPHPKLWHQQHHPLATPSSPSTPGGTPAAGQQYAELTPVLLQPTPSTTAGTEDREEVVDDDDEATELQVLDDDNGNVNNNNDDGDNDDGERRYGAAEYSASSQALLSPEPLLGSPMIGSPALLENTYIESQVVTDSDFKNHLASPYSHAASPAESVGGTDEMMSALGPETPLTATLAQEPPTEGALAPAFAIDAASNGVVVDDNDDDDEETEAISNILAEHNDDGNNDDDGVDASANESAPTAEMNVAAFDHDSGSSGGGGDAECQQRWMINRSQPLCLEYAEESTSMYDEQYIAGEAAFAHLEHLAVSTFGNTVYVVGCTSRELLVWYRTQHHAEAEAEHNSGVRRSGRKRRRSSKGGGGGGGGGGGSSSNHGSNSSANVNNESWSLQGVRAIVTPEEARQHLEHCKEHHRPTIVGLHILGGRYAAVVGAFPDSHVRTFDISVPASESKGTEGADWTAQPVDSGYNNEIPGAVTLLGLNAVAVGAWSSSAHEVNVYRYALDNGSANQLLLQKKVLFSHASGRPLSSLCSVAGDSNLIAGTINDRIFLWDTDQASFVCKADTADLLPPGDANSSSNPPVHEMLRCLTAFELPSSSAGGAGRQGGGSQSSDLAVLMVLDRVDTNAAARVVGSGGAAGAAGAAAEVAEDANARCVVTVLTRQFMNSATPSHHGQLLQVHELCGNSKAAKRRSSTSNEQADAEPFCPVSLYSCGQGAADLIFRGDSGGMLRVWNMEDTTPLLKIALQKGGESRFNVDEPGRAADANGISAVCANHSNRKVVVAFADGRLYILGQQQQLQQQQYAVEE